jgi:hypothetical protein
MSPRCPHWLANRIPSARRNGVDRRASVTSPPLLQKVVGESSPGEIIAQLAAIDEAEDRFTALRAAT